MVWAGYDGAQWPNGNEFCLKKINNSDHINYNSDMICGRGIFQARVP